MKVLFLDIDGVLNSADWFRRREQKHGFQNMFFHHCHDLDPAAIARLEKIVRETGAKIVVSSTWRRLHCIEEIGFMLSQIGGQEESFWEEAIIDRTPVLDKARGEEIHHWLVSHGWTRGDVSNFVIIDDDSDMLPEQLPHFFKTSWETGLLDHQVNTIIKFINFP